VWVWRFYETDEMGIARKPSVMLAGDAEGWPTEDHAWQASREFRYQRMELSSSQSFGALVRRYTREAMPERYSTRKSYRTHFEETHFATMGEAPVAEVKKHPQGGTMVEGAEAFPQNASNIKGLCIAFLSTRFP
jgi:hypothetical protein